MTPERATAGDSPLLQVRDLGVDVAGQPLLRGVSFAVQPDEKIAIVGPSGAGKSQLLRTIVGLQDAAAGEVLFRGGPRDVQGWPAYRRRVLYVPTLAPLLPGTVAENFSVVAAYASHDSEIAADLRDGLLGRLGVGGLLDRDVAVLSTGEQRRVAVARALALKPDVLLVDEPTNGLDTDHAAAVEEMLVDAGAVILVSHDRGLVERLAGRVVDVGGFVVRRDGEDRSRG